MKSHLKQNKERMSEEAMAKFQIEIEEIRKNVDSYTEAIAGYCEQHGADIEDIINLISNSLVEKIKREAISLRQVKIDPNDSSEGLELL